MARNVIETTGNGDFFLVKAHKPSGNRDAYIATVTIQGTFDGATAALKLSVDGGTTLIPMKDLTGTAYSCTSDDSVNISLGTGFSANGSDLELYLTVSGGGSPELTVYVHDNLG